MSKKKHQRRIWIGKIKHHSPEVWVSEDEVKQDLDFVSKLHPGELESSLHFLEEKGYISIRTSPTGKKEYRFNQDAVQAEINKLPPEKRSNRSIIIREDMAILCDYNNDATTMLCVAEQQTNKLIERKDIVPWITRSHEQLILDTMGTIDDLIGTLTWLEQKNYIEITQNGPDQYRYRLNLPTIQSALNALPIRHEGREA